ncbi:M14 family metallopeptidase [Bowmanella dokdonensis]|nr:M14 family metallocarboxypeptidase [Bowmanella dokdonensis]
MSQSYPIGTPGKPWGEAEKAAWVAAQVVQRSYFDEVVCQLEELKDYFDIVQYGLLQYQSDYPLYLLKSQNWQNDKPVALITGGVHGYETSGVQGALRFARDKAAQYTSDWNLLIAPCISPWGYETINRWNPFAIDPNRSFVPNSPAPESAAIMLYLQELGANVLLHVDLHETTDSDNSEFRPALAARDGTEHTNWNFPDGFYLVGDSHKPEAAMQRAVLDAVEKITHIAEADENNQLIGSPVVQPGVVNYDTKALGLCAGMTGAPYVTTTEVYPDSPKSSAEQCALAQVAAVTGALDFVHSQAGR